MSRTLADRAILVFLAPAHNTLTTAATQYSAQLHDPAGGPIPFIPLTLERAFLAMAAAGLPEHARALHRRFTDWWLVDGELDLEVDWIDGATGSRTAPQHASARAA